jgi:hypothetical protein
MLPSDFGENWTKWDDLFEFYSSEKGVTFEMLKTICMNESSLGKDPRVSRGLLHPEDTFGSVSEDGKSWGLMQLTLDTARDYDEEVTAEKLNDPRYSVRIAALLLNNLWVAFEDEEYVVRAYNAGGGAVRKNPSAAERYWFKYKAHKGLLESE